MFLLRQHPTVGWSGLNSFMVEGLLVSSETAKSYVAMIRIAKKGIEPTVVLWYDQISR